MMKRTVGILAAILALQVVVAAAVWSTQRQPSQSGDTPLLPAVVTEAEALVLSDGDGNQVRLARQEGQWMVTTTGEPDTREDGNTKVDGDKSAPQKADGERVERLLKQLAQLRQGFPVANSADARERFGVGADSYRRKLVVVDEDQPLATLWLGRSPSMGESYVRVDGADDDNAIFRVALAEYQLPTEAKDWRAPQQKPDTPDTEGSPDKDKETVPDNG